MGTSQPATAQPGLWVVRRPSARAVVVMWLPHTARKIRTAIDARPPACSSRFAASWPPSNGAGSAAVSKLVNASSKKEP